MKREIKPGMKFLMPVEVMRAYPGTVHVKTPGLGAGLLSMHKARLDGLTPEGSWPREPFKHGDIVIWIKGTVTGRVWGDEVDGQIVVDFGGSLCKRTASTYKLVGS